MKRYKSLDQAESPFDDLRGKWLIMSSKIILEICNDGSMTGKDVELERSSMSEGTESLVGCNLTNDLVISGKKTPLSSLMGEEILLS